MSPAGGLAGSFNRLNTDIKSAIANPLIRVMVKGLGVHPVRSDNKPEDEGLAVTRW